MSSLSLYPSLHPFIHTKENRELLSEKRKPVVCVCETGRTAFRLPVCYIDIQTADVVRELRSNKSVRAIQSADEQTSEEEEKKTPELLVFIERGGAWRDHGANIKASQPAGNWVPETDQIRVRGAQATN